MLFSELVGKKCLGIIPITKQNTELWNSEYTSLDSNIDDDDDDERYMEMNNEEYIKHFYMLVGEELLYAKWLLFASKNKKSCFSWYDNWIIIDDGLNYSEEIDSKFKYIGEKIKEIWTDGYIIKNDIICANFKKWMDCVGKEKGVNDEWIPKSIPYKFITIKMNTKHIDLTTMYHDCHYPETIWNYL